MHKEAMQAAEHWHTVVSFLICRPIYCNVLEIKLNVEHSFTSAFFNHATEFY